jgi:4a-hydroxytetrahydrobiopterin dehydratase
MAVRALNSKEITEALESLKNWRLEGREIVKTFEFTGFLPAMGFVNQVALVAERQDHHPDLLLQYNKVTLRLSTHDAGGLSERDFRFAQTVDALGST